MKQSVKIIAILTARNGKTEELFELLHSIRPQCLAEPGNLRWDIWQDDKDIGRFALDELYKDAAAAATHRQTPHFKDYAARIGEIADCISFTLEPVEVGPDGD